MQLVGRSCEICGERVKQERGVVGCAGCDLVVHDACARREDHRAGYRDGASEGAKRPKKRTACPRCGDDLTARKRAEDRERDRIFEEAQAKRPKREREDDAARDRRLWAVLLIIIGLGVRFLAAMLGD